MKENTRIITAKITQIYKDIPDDVMDEDIEKDRMVETRNRFVNMLKRDWGADDVTVEIQNFVLDIEEE